MAEYPHMPFFVDAYLADTTHLSTTEHGAYLLLLMAAWRRQDCDLPDDDVLLAKLVRQPLGTWRQRLRPALAPFFMIADGVWRQKRQTAIRNHVAEVTEKRRDAAKMRHTGGTPLPRTDGGGVRQTGESPGKPLKHNGADHANAPTRARNPNPNPKEVREDSESRRSEPVPATPSPTARSALWLEMKGWVGGSHASAGKFLGLQASQYGEGALVEGYFAARKADPQGDRRAYLTGLLQRQAGTRGTDRSPMAVYERLKRRMNGGDPYADHDVSHLLALMPSGTVQ